MVIWNNFLIGRDAVYCVSTLLLITCNRKDMNIKEIVKQDLKDFKGICVREGNIPLEELKKTNIAMAYLFNRQRAKQYIGKDVLVAGAGNERGKYFTAKIKDVLSVRELSETNKFEAGINLNESIFGSWISDNIDKDKAETAFLDKRMAIRFENPTDVKTFNTDWVSFSRPSFYYIDASQHDDETDSDLFRIKKLTISNFLNFSSFNEEFASGINVIIGKNNIGKTGLIKFLYANAKATEEYIGLKGTTGERNFKELLSNKVQQTFQSSERIGTIVCKTSDEGLNSVLTFDYGEEKDTKEIKFSLQKNTQTVIPNLSPFIIEEYEKNTPEFNATFIPSKEILSIADAIEVAVNEYIVGIDATYTDLIKYTRPLFKREDAYDEHFQEILNLFKSDILEGEIKYDSDTKKYYYYDNDSNRFDLTMTAEGIRQLGIIPILIKRMVIRQGTILFLDEPDNNINPFAIKKLVEVLLKLANAGVQIFLTTHDHLLSQLVSLHAEYRHAFEKKKEQIPEMKFFALYKDETGKTAVEKSETIAGIQNNSILDEFANLYDKEIEFYMRSKHK